MAENQTAQDIPMSPPYLGQLDKVPLAAIQSPYCQYLTNFATDNQRIALRHGDKQLSRATTTAGDGVRAIKSTRDNTGVSNVVTMEAQVGADVKYYASVAASNFALAHTVAGRTAIRSHVNQFGGRIYFFDEGGTLATTTQGVSLALVAGTWTDTPYTLSGGFVPVCAGSYRNRIYIANFQTYVYTYGEVNAIAGATTDVDLTSVFNTQGQLYAIRAMSSSDVVQAQAFLCFISSSGDVLAYTGTYPGSADWALAGQFNLPPVLGYDAVIDFRGDSLIMTVIGVYSLRDLLLKGSQAAEDNSITGNIVNRWQQIVKAYVTNSQAAQLRYVTGVWDSTNHRIIIAFPIYVDRSGAIDADRAFFLVYDFTNQAWSEDVGSKLGGASSGTLRNSAFICGDRDNTYYSSSVGTALYIKEGKANFKDDDWTGGADNPYPFQLRSAPISLSKTSTKKFGGIEVIAKGDYQAVGSFTIIGDLGRVTSGASNLPSQGTGVLKQLVNAGVDATYVQWDLSSDGTVAPANVGCEIYAINATYQEGGMR